MGSRMSRPGAAGPMVAVVVVACLSLVGCGQKNAPEQKTYTYPLDSLDDVITQSGVSLDEEIKAEGTASLRVTVEAGEQPHTIRLFELGDLDVEEARLLYQARLRCQDLNGQAFLEMLCHFPGQGEFFSRALQDAITGTTDWTTQETIFYLQKDENPDNVMLNLVVTGPGTVWIDDIKVTVGALQ
jgi:hypothetical protein